jgi:chemotaxis family two-component system response regulator Rcp1
LSINVLIVEDNPCDVFLVVEALTFASIPHTIQIIKDGAKAIEFLDRMGDDAFACPDLILLDLNLPKVSGLEILSKIRDHCKGAEIPVIVYSSSAAPADQGRAEQLNARFFRKPIELEEWMQLGQLIRDITHG